MTGKDWWLEVGTEKGKDEDDFELSDCTLIKWRGLSLLFEVDFAYEVRWVRRRVGRIATFVEFNDGERTTETTG